MKQKIEFVASHTMSLTTLIAPSGGCIYLHLFSKMELLSLCLCSFLFFLKTSPAPTFWPSSPAGPWCSAVLWRCPARVGWVGWAWRHGMWCAPPASRGPCTVWRKALVVGARTLRHWQAIRSGAPAWAPRWWPSWGCRSGAKAHSNSTSKVSPVRIWVSVFPPPHFSSMVN